MCTLEGAIGPMDTVRSMSTDKGKEYLAVSDSGGHIRLFHAPKIDPATPEGTAASFSQVCPPQRAQSLVHPILAVVPENKRF
jgi:hypothetical protein